MSWDVPVWSVPADITPLDDLDARIDNVGEAQVSLALGFRRRRSTPGWHDRS
jgi:hypothetical protein